MHAMDPWGQPTSLVRGGTARPFGRSLYWHTLGHVAVDQLLEAAADHRADGAKLLWLSSKRVSPTSTISRKTRGLQRSLTSSRDCAAGQAVCSKLLRFMSPTVPTA